MFRIVAEENGLLKGTVASQEYVRRDFPSCGVLCVGGGLFRILHDVDFVQV